MFVGLGCVALGTSDDFIKLGPIIQDLVVVSAET